MKKYFLFSFLLVATVAAASVLVFCLHVSTVHKGLEQVVKSITKIEHFAPEDFHLHTEPVIRNFHVGISRLEPIRGFEINPQNSILNFSKVIYFGNRHPGGWVVHYSFWSFLAAESESEIFLFEVGVLVLLFFSVFRLLLLNSDFAGKVSRHLQALEIGYLDSNRLVHDMMSPLSLLKVLETNPEMNQEHKFMISLCNEKFLQISGQFKTKQEKIFQQDLCTSSDIAEIIREDLKDCRAKSVASKEFRVDLNRVVVVRESRGRLAKSLRPLVHFSDKIELKRDLQGFLIQFDCSTMPRFYNLKLVGSALVSCIFFLWSGWKLSFEFSNSQTANFALCVRLRPKNPS